MRLVRCPVCKNHISKGAAVCAFCGKEFSRFQYFRMNYLWKVIAGILLVNCIYSFGVIIKYNHEIQKYLEKLPSDISVIEKLEERCSRLSPMQKALVRRKEIKLIRERIKANESVEIVENVKMELHLEDGKREGKYWGQVVDGVPNGNGKFEYFDDNMMACSYEGEFSKGSINGKGTMTKEGGEIREGHFINGVLNGDAVIYKYNKATNTSTRVFEGNIVNNVMHGYGTLYNEEGIKIFDGNFYHGLPSSSEYEKQCYSVKYDELYQRIGDFRNKNIVITGLVSDVNISHNLDITYIITPYNQYGHYIFMKNKGNKSYDMSIGKEVSIYGFCTGVTEFVDRNGNILTGIGVDAFYTK